MRVATGRSSPEPFGRRNRRAVKKPALTKPSKQNRRESPQINSKLYLYLAGGILFLFLAGYGLSVYRGHGRATSRNTSGVLTFDSSSQPLALDSADRLPKDSLRAQIATFRPALYPIVSTVKFIITI
jgi:hypothetical protein